MMKKPEERVLILDFGSQYSALIARCVRELGVYADVVPYSVSSTFIRDVAPKAIILSGGPESVRGSFSPRAPDVVFELGIPVLGICYGMQTMAEQLGGEVMAGHQREFGFARIQLSKTPSLLAGLEDYIDDTGQSFSDVWMSHGDQVGELPPSFTTMASTDNCKIAAMADETRRYYGLQFHPEVSHTPQGKRMLERFLREIAGCQSTWTVAHILEDSLVSLKEEIGSDRVLLGLSGGVDSSVAALMLHHAIGDQLICVFVDTGLLRQNEAQEVEAIFVKHFGVTLITVDASETFYSALRGVSDPEAKRRIIGKTFIDVFDNEAKKLGDIRWLAQGTIYSDVIESAAAQAGVAHVIKSHHNVGGLPENMRFKLIEPLRYLFKDEVRDIGLRLGLPHELLHRHPFPGPGLGVRVLGEIKPAYLPILRHADAILIDELRAANLYHAVSQAFVVFMPVKSVGVVGDARQYEYVVAIRMVETKDFMTATWSKVPYAFLETVSSRILNEVAGISRVTYDISSKPPATIEWE